MGPLRHHFELPSLSQRAAGQLPFIPEAAPESWSPICPLLHRSTPEPQIRDMRFHDGSFGPHLCFGAP